MGGSTSACRVGKKEKVEPSDEESEQHHPCSSPTAISHSDDSGGRVGEQMQGLSVPSYLTPQTAGQCNCCSQPHAWAGLGCGILYFPPSNHSSKKSTSIETVFVQWVPFPLCKMLFTLI